MMVVPWFYQALAQVIKAHSLIRSFPEVNPDKIGMVGISWGSMITSCVSALDSRLQFAIPIFGCGYLVGTDEIIGTDISFGIEEDEAYLKNLMDNFEPSIYLPYTKIPMLFVNGATDVYFPIISNSKSADAIKGKASIHIEQNYGHGYLPAWGTEEVYAFADHIIRKRNPLFEIKKPKLNGLKLSVEAPLDEINVETIILYYTTDTTNKKWSDKKWLSKSLSTKTNMIEEVLPPNFLAAYVDIQTKEGLSMSSLVVTP